LEQKYLLAFMAGLFLSGDDLTNDASQDHASSSL
jgi:hypothetical protein